ncbi:MAG: alpha/beta fold hydrolase [Pyrinomonadaceae bacterium]
MKIQFLANHKCSRHVLFFFTSAILLCGGITAQNLNVKEIMREPSIAGQRAEGARLSPNGKYIIFLWNLKAEEPRDLFLATEDGAELKKLLSPPDLAIKQEKPEKPDPLEYGVEINDDFAKSQRNGFGNLQWSPDSSKFIFTQNGDIFIFKLGDEKPRRLTKTESFEFAANFLDNERILFQQGGNFFAINTNDGTLTQISKEANPAKNISVFNATTSDDTAMIAYVASDGSDQKPLFIPNYLGLFTTAPTTRRGWTKSNVYATKTDGTLDKAIEIDLPKQEGEAYIAGLEWLSDNKTLILDRVDKTHKRKQIFAVTFIGEKASAFLVYEEHDEKWIGGPTRILESNPANAGEFLFSSEADHWNHLYLAKIDPAKFADGKANAVVSQITKGNFEIDWATWFSPENIIYSSTEAGTAERQLYTVSKAGGVRAKLTNTAGMKGEFQIARDAKDVRNLIYSGSTWNRPDEIFLEKVCSVKCENVRPIQITRTTPEGFLTRKWNAPQFVSIPSRDDKQIAARFYLPSGFDKKKKHPMVIFVHGAGYLQNVINGWNGYYREFMFNQLLTQKGYVVLDIDYRGSAGYGRDWRTDVYDFLGGKDFDDHIDAIDWMVRNYGVDQNRIGTYGGSYGGFMAAMLVMRAPERISAAAALRPVMDWKNYYAANPFYTSQRLGAPKENPDAYKRSSPIAYAEKLEKHLLILHGLIDDNVQAQDSIQLVEKLMRSDKTEFFELMLYPSERHGFQRPSSWEDEYERILAEFENYLK